MSKFGLLPLFHPLAYVITISSPIISALAPGIELAGADAVIPVSSFCNLQYLPERGEP